MQVTIAKSQYGIDFFDADGTLVKEWMSYSLAERETLYVALGDDEAHPEWPDAAVRAEAWERHPIPTKEPKRRNPLTGHYVGGARREW